MQEVIKQLEFRPFSYEEDAESLVDLHRCMETLEGGWFDSVSTCRMHSKIIARTPGSSWVISVGGTVLGHAYMLNNHDGTGLVSRWRLHPDFRFPEMASSLLQGLCREARKRAWTGLLILADSDDICRDLETTGLRRDRTYRWLQFADLEPGEEAVITRFSGAVRDFSAQPLLRFLGSPFPPDYVINQAIMATEYGVFNFTHPSLFAVSWQETAYLACFDGREWFVFRQESRDTDRAAVGPVLRALCGIGNGRMLVNENALAAAAIVPMNQAGLYDFFISLLE